MEKLSPEEAKEAQKQALQQQGIITQDQLFQVFTKNHQALSNQFQMLFDGAIEMKQQNQILMKILQENNIPNPFLQPQEVRPPNRKERREAERKEEKKKKAK